MRIPKLVLLSCSQLWSKQIFNRNFFCFNPGSAVGQAVGGCDEENWRNTFSAKFWLVLWRQWRSLAQRLRRTLTHAKTLTHMNTYTKQSHIHTHVNTYTNTCSPLHSLTITLSLFLSHTHTHSLPPPSPVSTKIRVATSPESYHGKGKST